MIDITSTSNDHYKRWLDLSTSRGIKKHREFILMGEKLIEEFLANPNFKIKAEIIHEELRFVTNGKNPIYKLPKAMFNEVDVIGTHYNLLVLETKDIEDLDALDMPTGLEVVCPLGDPNNLGAMARSALAFGAGKFILTEESSNPYHPKAIKASAGALLNLPLAKTGKLVDFATENDTLYALDMKGESVGRFRWPKDVRLVVGEEGPGLTHIKGLKKLSVPTTSVESLNASVAASIAMFCYYNHHTKNN